MQDKRKHKRYTIDDKKFHVKMAIANDVQILDISIGGISLKADRKLYINKQYALKLKSKDQVINVTGAVKWSSLWAYKNYDYHGEFISTFHGGLVPIYSAGMQFMNISDSKYDELIHLINDSRFIPVDQDNIFLENDLIDLSEYLLDDLLDAEKTNSHPEETSDDIRKKSIAEKRKIALLCGKEERLILLKDLNKEVVLAALENPKVTETEIAGIAKLPTIPVEAINKIIHKRAWMKNYGVLSALVNNPKTPAYIAVKLVNKLKTRDLKILERNREVSQAVRSIAKKRIYSQI